MSRYVRLRELVLGIEGLAILRGLVDACEKTQSGRIDEIRGVLDNYDAEPWSIGLRVFELDHRAGYAAWAPTYDTMANALIRAEQPIVEELTADLPPNQRVLDAACGTGRHTEHLARNGHDVTGIDASPDMLALARSKVPGATFTEGDFCSLDFADDSFDLVVCSLALTHTRDLNAPISEFARVTRPGGRIVLSDIHPMNVLILGQGFFTDEKGDFAFVRNYVHHISTYIDAFVSAGLTVRACVEPLGDTAAAGPATQFFPEAAAQAVDGLPFALVWDLRKPSASSRD
jgi:ubiquinone/menaquinone biosynthesis C-methylase UbiE